MTTTTNQPKPLQIPSRTSFPIINQVIESGLTFKFVLILTCIGLALRVLWFFYALPFPTFSDAAIYFNLALNFVDYGAYVEVFDSERNLIDYGPDATIQDGDLVPYAYFLPGYPAFLAPFLMISRSFISTAFANIVVSTLLIPITYLLVKRLFQIEMLALIATVLCTFQPSFVVYGSSVQSENLFSFLFYGGFLLLILKPQLSLKRVIIASIFLGSSCLVRGEALFYMPSIMLAGLLLTKSPDADAPWKKWAILLIIPLIVCSFLGSWMARNYSVFGTPTLSTTAGLNFYMAHNDSFYGYQNYPDLVEMLAEESGDEPLIYASPEAADAMMKVGLEHWRNNPGAILEDIALGTFHLYRPTFSVNVTKDFPIAASLKLIAWVLVLLATAFSVKYWPQLNWRPLCVLLSMLFMNWLCYTVIFWSEPRYRFAIEEIFLIFAAVCLTFLFQIKNKTS